MRIPGLRRNDGIEQFAASKGLQVWSADFPADDWRDVSAARVYDLAIRRLEAKGKGILLLHDIQPRTVTALPRILRELKARGYRIVHVVPATPERPATPTGPEQWQRPGTEMVAVSRWPKVPRFAFAGTAALPAPAFSDLDWRNIDLGTGPQRPARTARLWPSRMTLPADHLALATLPAPAAGIFRIPESTRVTMLAKGPRATEVSAKLAGKSRRHGRVAAVRPPPSAEQPAQHAGGATPNPMAQGKK